MSRTYRRDAIDIDLNDKPYAYDASWWDEVDNYCLRMDYYSKRNKKHDSKPWSKSPGWYKKIKARARRAKIRNVMVHANYDNIPRFRKTNACEWS